MLIDLSRTMPIKLWSPTLSNLQRYHWRVKTIDFTGYLPSSLSNETLVYRDMVKCPDCSEETPKSEVNQHEFLNENDECDCFSRRSYLTEAFEMTWRTCRSNVHCVHGQVSTKSTRWNVVSDRLIWSLIDCSFRFISRPFMPIHHVHFVKPDSIP